MFMHSTQSTMPTYKSREEAGEAVLKVLVAKNIIKVSVSNFVIIAIPNGGIPVALPIANHFQKKLHVIISRKIQYPWTTESGFGALTSDGIEAYNEDAIKSARLSYEIINIQKKKTLEDIKKREQLFNKYIVPKGLENYTVILVDDGLASGITMEAAIRSLINKGVVKIVVAVPTAHGSSIQRIKNVSISKKICNIDVVCPRIEHGYSFAVANAYWNWYDEEESHVLKMLEKMK